MKLVASLLLAAAVASAGWAAVHVLGGGPTSVAATSRNGTVASVRLDGPSLPIVTLQEALRTRVGAPLRSADLSVDRGRISDMLLDRGHLAVAVSEPEVRPGARGAHVTFRVVPGGIYQVGNVIFEGNTHPQETLATAQTVRPGDTVSPERAQRGAEQVDQWLAEHGAPDAKVGYRLDVRHSDLQADVVYTVTRTRVVRR